MKKFLLAVLLTLALICGVTDANRVHSHARVHHVSHARHNTLAQVSKGGRRSHRVVRVRHRVVRHRVVRVHHGYSGYHGYSYGGYHRTTIVDVILGIVGFVIFVVVALVWVCCCGCSSGNYDDDREEYIVEERVEIIEDVYSDC